MIKNLRKRCKNKKGFTMVELIVVIVIILILAAVLVPQLLKYVDKANEATCKADAATLLSQIQSDYAASQAEEAGINEPGTGDNTEMNGVTIDKASTAAVSEAAADHVAYGVEEASTTGFKDVTSLAYNNGKYTAVWASGTWTVTKNSASNP